MPQFKIEDLNKFYSEADQADQELFAEQRSNVNLVLGNHYQNKGSKFWNRIRDSRDLTNEQRIRLTKNHIQKITKTYINNILSQAPGVSIKPKNDSEVQDQKAAELHSAVWAHTKEQTRYRTKVRQWAEDYVNIGEAHVKIFWENEKGTIVGYQPEMDPDTGMPFLDENGQIAKSDRAIWSGQLTFERIFAFNLLRDPNAKAFEDAEWLCYRKMASISELKDMVGNDQERLKYIQESADETYTVFDAANGSYKSVKDQVMVREFYFRPNARYPRGYFYITTAAGILFEGELPLGVFPIVSVGFDEIATSPRSRSIIKQLRPFQAEINRASSRVAETQVTLGEDKLIIQDGAKISHGGTVPGVRAVKVTGAPPTVLPGRSGEQYLPYIAQQIEEMYSISNVKEEMEELPSQLDAYTLLFRSLRNKKKFVVYGEKFEQFLIDVANVALRLTKAYIQPNALIPAIGRKEFINIAEFKSADDLSHQILVEPQEDNIETKMGRQLTMNHVLQFVGQQLGPEEIGRIIQNMPYANHQEAFSDFTIDYENVKNDILAMDRGEYKPARPSENHTYAIKRLVHRTKQPDFEQLPPMIQQMYDMKIKEHSDLESENQRKLIAAKNDLIPSQGYLVPVDFYVSDPKDPAKTRRARVPYDALAWLIQRLEDQGNYINSVSNLSPYAQAQLADSMRQGGGQGSPQQQSPLSIEEAQMAQLAMNQQAQGDTLQ